MSVVNLALALAAVLLVAALLAHLLRAFLTVSVLAAMAASSAESRGSSLVTTCLVGKATSPRQRSGGIRTRRLPAPRSVVVGVNAL